MKVKGIMFSGFAAAILMGAVDASAATAFNIASQAYVDQEVGKETTARTTALQSYSTTEQMNTAITDAVSAEATRAKAAEQANADAITAEVSARQALAQTVDGLTGTGENSVDSKIDNALGSAFKGENAFSDVSAALNTKVDKTTTVNAKALNGNIVLDGGDVAVKTGYAKATAAEAIAAGNTIDSALGKLEYKADTNATAIATETQNRTDADTAINNKIGTGFDSTNTVASAIATETQNRTNADTALQNQIGTGFDSTNTVAKAIAGEKTRAEGIESGLNTRLNSVETTLGDGTTNGLVKDVANLKSNMGEAGSVESQINNKLGDLGTGNNTVADALAKKVDKTTTVNGHALSDNVTVTKADVGLGNVDNTSDLNKPISTATQAALDGKINMPTSGTCNAASGRCVLTVDTTGALAWIDVTTPLN